MEPSRAPDGSPVTTQQLPTGEQLIAYLQAHARPDRSDHQLQLDRYDAHFQGTQYHHQTKDWWGRDADNSETISPAVALPGGFVYADPQAAAVNLLTRDKRPTAPMNLCKAIVKRFTGLLLSASRQPRVIVHGDADSEAFLQAVRNTSRFWPAMRSARNGGGGVGSTLVTVHVRDGKFSYEVHRTQDCTVVWKDRATWTPLAVLKLYEFKQQVPSYNDKKQFIGMTDATFLYRRIMTPDSDITYKPIRKEEGMVMNWVVDPELSSQHNLGLFPGCWIQNTPNSENPDGAPDCDGAWQMLDTMDRLIAQANRGVLANCDPTVTLRYDPKDVALAGGIRKGSDNALYVGKDGEARYMEITGEGIMRAYELCDRLKQSVLDVTQCVLVDPEKISGAAQSARAIEYIYAPMIERADDLRDQYGDGIIRLMGITLQIARRFLSSNAVDENGRPLAFQFDLPPRMVEELDPETGEKVKVPLPQRVGSGTNLELLWGPYFQPTESDNQTRIANATAARGSVIATDTATRYVGDIFGVEDVPAELQKIQNEQEQLVNQTFVPGLGVGQDTGEGEGAGAAAGGAAAKPAITKHWSTPKPPPIPEHVADADDGGRP